MEEGKKAGKKKERKKERMEEWMYKLMRQSNKSKNILKAIFKKIKLFSQSDVKRECQPGTQSAKQACSTVKHSASGMQARFELRPAYESIKKVVLQCHLSRNNIEIRLKSFNSIHATSFTSIDTATAKEKSLYKFANLLWFP